MLTKDILILRSSQVPLETLMRNSCKYGFKVQIGIKNES